MLIWFSNIFLLFQVNVETWKCIATLNSHTGDVLDLAWAPHDGWLASCSVDNSVIVWNTLKFPEKVAVLKGHTGLVKVIHCVCVRACARVCVCVTSKIFYILSYILEILTVIICL